MTRLNGPIATPCWQVCALLCVFTPVELNKSNTYTYSDWFTHGDTRKVTCWWEVRQFIINKKLRVNSWGWLLWKLKILPPVFSSSTRTRQCKLLEARGGAWRTHSHTHTHWWKPAKTLLSLYCIALLIYKKNK